jgi:hypothetical protein
VHCSVRGVHNRSCMYRRQFPYTCFVSIWIAPSLISAVPFTRILSELRRSIASGQCGIRRRDSPKVDRWLRACTLPPNVKLRRFDTVINPGAPVTTEAEGRCAASTFPTTTKSPSLKELRNSIRDKADNTLAHVIRACSNASPLLSLDLACVKAHICRYVSGSSSNSLDYNLSNP